MKIPKRLKPLVEEGVIDSVVRQLEADKRSFRQAADYEQVATTVDLDGVMREIDDARLEEAARQFRLQERR